MKNKRKGKRTIGFECPPAIVSCASVVGKMEGEGPLGGYFDIVEKMGCSEKKRGKQPKVRCRQWR